VVVGSLAVMLVSGMLRFNPEAIKLYGHAAFSVKLRSLLLSILFTSTVWRRSALADPHPLQRRLVVPIPTVPW